MCSGAAHQLRTALATAVPEHRGGILGSQVTLFKDLDTGVEMTLEEFEAMQEARALAARAAASASATSPASASRVSPNAVLVLCPLWSRGPFQTRRQPSALDSRGRPWPVIYADRYPSVPCLA